MKAWNIVSPVTCKKMRAGGKSPEGDFLLRKRAFLHRSTTATYGTLLSWLCVCNKPWSLRGFSVQYGMVGQEYRIRSHSSSNGHDDCS